VHLRFKGQLLLPSEPGPGLRVNLELAGHHLAVESESGGLGAWPLETVRVRRLEGDTFAMTVAGEDLHFVADDTISFAYSGIPAIESVSGPARGRSRLRSLLDRFGSESPEPTRPTVMPSSPTVTADESSPLAPQPVEEELSGDVDHPEPMAAETFETTEPIEEEVIDMTALWVESEPEPDPETWYQPDPSTIEDAATQPSDQHQLAEEEQPAGCPGLTNDGLPCRSPILSPSGYCYPHDPDRTVEDGYRKALEARAKLKRKGTARLTRVYSRLEKAMRQVERGELEPDIAVAMAQLARTMCAILDLDDDETEDKSESGLTPKF
jgi:hypothetical protein